MRWDRTSTVRFTLSKISSVKVRIWGTRGMSLSRDFAKLPRGDALVRVAPAGPRPLPLRIEARAERPAGVEKRTIRVTPPAKPKKKKSKHEEAQAGEAGREAQAEGVMTSLNALPVPNLR